MAGGPLWRCGDHSLQRTSRPLLMGILNVTPDSFSDGGQYTDVAAAVDQAFAMQESGADIVDIGGESTRPGATPVSEKDELSRVLPVIEALEGQLTIPVSIDTTKALVAREAVGAGAAIINDVSGMSFDPAMPQVCAETQVGLCVMHIRGTPQTMQDDPRYDDVVQTVTETLQARFAVLTEMGINPQRLCGDPGIGFGKTAEHNLALLRATPAIRETLGRPLLIGHSRKRFLAALLGRPVEERLAGTVGVSVALANLQADVLRIHDVRAVSDALAAYTAIIE